MVEPSAVLSKVTWRLIPFLFLFAALIRLQREPAGPEVLRVPGGRPVAVLLGAVGFTTTSAAIALSFLPAPDEIHKGRAFAKILGLTLLMIGSGVVAYALAVRRRRLAAPSAGADRNAPGEASREGR